MLKKRMNRNIDHLDQYLESFAFFIYMINLTTAKDIIPTTTITNKLLLMIALRIVGNEANKLG